MELELIKTFIEYHLDMTRRIWESIREITEEQFLADDAYSRGSIRNLMVHLSSTDRRWLAGLKNLADYSSTLTEVDLNSPNDKVAEPRWQVILHIINHGTDHRSTVLQRLHEFGAPTFDQDFIMWLWSKK